MNEMKRIIIRLAETCREPEEFIRRLERLSRVSPIEKGSFFLEVGRVLHKFSYFALALNSWNQALEYFTKDGDKMGEARCYGNLGLAHLSLGDFKKAIEYHEKALEIFVEVNDRVGESKCYTNLGLAYLNFGDFRRAIEYHEKSLEIDREVGDKSGESACYTNLGNAYHNLGEFRKAIERHEKSLEIDREVGDKSGESACYTNLGNAYHNLGEFRKAISYHEKSLKIDREIGDRSGQAKIYGNLGLAHLSLGDFRKAIQYHRKSLKTARETGDKTGEAKYYTNLGIASNCLGDLNKAIGYHEKALRIKKEIGDRAGEAKCYANIGVAHRSLGDFRKAIGYHENSLEIAREIGDRAVESACYGNLGFAYRCLGDFRKAVECHKKSVEISKKIGDADSERIGNLNLGLAFYESEPELAFSYLEKSAELSEMISGKLVEEEHKIGFYAQASDAYQYMVPLCLKMGREREAFEYVERGRSRAFLDLLAATQIRPAAPLTSKLRSLLGKEEENLVKLRGIQLRYLRQTKVPIELGEVEKIRKNLNQIYDKIERFDPEYVFTRRGEPLSLEKVQRTLSSQREDMVLVEYFITKDKTYIFVVSSRDRELNIETISVSEGRLNQCIENYRREVANYPHPDDMGTTWLALNEYLIQPISEYLSEGSLVYFVPYGFLHYLPLHALQLEDEPIITRHPVAYFPSASLISFCRRKGSGKLESCASFGVASKKDKKDVALLIEEEAKDIAGLFSATPVNGSLATKDRVLGTCRGKDVIHFSCHGRFNGLDPLSSGVELFDGVLSAREIFDVRFNTELVTLSACQTGLNKRSPGDELIGLTRALIYAGAPSVVVSLWSVDARSTQELMIEFYSLLKTGKDKATALQEAQKKIMEREEYSHPYYWAPFILVGDWE